MDPAACFGSVLAVVYLAVHVVVEGEKARICSGQQFLPNQCPSGSIITIVSTVGGFGTSNTPCNTSTLDCTTVYLQGALPEANGNLAAFVKGKCENKQTCGFTVDSSWQSASSYCQSKVYNIVYVDVEYNCNIRVAPSSTGSIKATTVDITTFDNGSGVPTTEGTEINTKEHNTTDLTTTNKNENIDSAEGGKSTNYGHVSVQWWYIVVGLGSILLVVIVVIAAVCLRRRRKKRPSASTEGKYSFSSHPNNRESRPSSADDTNDANCYTTADTASASNTPAILCDDMSLRHDVRDSTYNPYATSRDVAENKRRSNEVNSDVKENEMKESSADTYAVIEKNWKKEIIPNEDTVGVCMVDNPLYVKASN